MTSASSLSTSSPADVTGSYVAPINFSQLFTSKIPRRNEAVDVTSERHVSTLTVGQSESTEKNPMSVVDQMLAEANGDMSKHGSGASSDPRHSHPDPLQVTVPSVKKSASRLWVNTFNVNVRNHDEQLFEHELLIQVATNVCRSFIVCLLFLSFVAHNNAQ